MLTQAVMVGQEPLQQSQGRLFNTQVGAVVQHTFPRHLREGLELLVVDWGRITQVVFMFRELVELLTQVVAVAVATNKLLVVQAALAW
jgi:hypothetical protein